MFPFFSVPNGDKLYRFAKLPEDSWVPLVTGLSRGRSLASFRGAAVGRNALWLGFDVASTGASVASVWAAWSDQLLKKRWDTKSTKVIRLKWLPAHNIYIQSPIFPSFHSVSRPFKTSGWQFIFQNVKCQCQVTPSGTSSRLPSHFSSLGTCEPCDTMQRYLHTTPGIMHQSNLKHTSSATSQRFIPQYTYIKSYSIISYIPLFVSLLDDLQVKKKGANHVKSKPGNSWLTPTWPSASNSLCRMNQTTARVKADSKTSVHWQDFQDDFLFAMHGGNGGFFELQGSLKLDIWKNDQTCVVSLLKSKIRGHVQTDLIDSYSILFLYSIL